jgi:hypothetical protein
MPWGVDCPWGDHTISDCISELFTPEDRDKLSMGQAGMPCPICGQFLTFPRGFRKDAAAWTGDEKIYWSRAIWDTYTEKRKDYLRSHVPDVEKWLR